MNQLKPGSYAHLPTVADADVVVVGGGPGGLGAAVMAARAGASTILVERYGYLGGMAASGEVHPFMMNHVDGRTLDAPVYPEWIERMHRYLPQALRDRIPFSPDIATNELRYISKDAAILAAEDLCREAGVRLLYHHWLADVVQDGRRIRQVVLVSKSGFSLVRGACFVDSTGDGDLAVLSGCRHEAGGPTGHGQPMTLCFKLSHVDRSRIPERAEINRLYAEARTEGVLNCPRENVLYFFSYDDDVVHFNTTRVIHRNGTDGQALSDAEQEGRQQVREYLKFLRHRVTGFEQARLHSIGHHIGVRETRRITGLRQLTREAFVKALKFPDGVVRCRYAIDIHHPDGAGTEWVHMPENEYYEIPFGCLVAADVDNLTIGCRAISVDHALHSSMRVMPPVCSVGQAAGMGAALAASRGGRLSDLDGVEVRNRLRDCGARL
ncbi:MAG: hypothetical protein A2498_12510 [Lentisphaerae bacterium RIFOXYC12_FULL_60_16]|nr:MAG: hypothetical protein A2498_12510 [Lentisphaerae bacterium RIFOXYC12_FULL_60_16]OGV74748.1 MAG: hypothetical protein A2269_06050 [Lentisphaerae bacterium RIFOXYA12_FULL_60_10]OGV78283.1 MAG: hypothetical protein A2340_08695 [Lentisphaerae bacterium RIFOXYB12_FULL_60_10]